MSDPRDPHPLEFGGPATYRIVVQGRLDESLSERLAGMRIKTESRRDRAPEVTLVGRLLDQAELSGVLGTLRGMRLPILSAERIDDEES
ncbi:MAG: hypothetical protein WBB46_09695 [Candidatus Deferrimicrobiaceae bacterium]